ncbi:MAG: bifunctional phosphopantothenoylcysteine decarboxylase/phosphopantothenate--cysteine ligase CoaBC [Acidimicrobiaceae bacterium]|nr:bifunctional phosphopantothenoylcysteine decarboxylase/phosphopantothenate--cysteine ligase CoaBC [Acidimicrobiaceae bacterium]
MRSSGSTQKTVVLCISGGIAAYKAVEIARRLFDLGYHVVPVMTEDAKRFVGETTFSALSSEPVRSSLWNSTDPVPHTTLARRADLVLVAPATANVISKFANGASDDLVSAVLIAARSKVLIAPAMHTEMWENPAVRRNIEFLAATGVSIVQPGVGRLAGGDFGAGRMAEPHEIVAMAQGLLEEVGKIDLAGLEVVVSAGGTREAIDPVRFIGNRSSGRQGYAFAEVALAGGASVSLVSTVENLPPPNGAKMVSVESASEMSAAMKELSKTADIIVMAAAVADFRVEDQKSQKIKKGDGVPEIRLVHTEDILAYLGANRSRRQVIVGFAAETGDPENYARDKLSRKGADIIVGNDVTSPGAGFATETNSVFIVESDRDATYLERVSKRRVAEVVLARALEILSSGPKV